VIPGSRQEDTQLLEAQAAGVERGGIEVGAELIERPCDVIAEHVLDDPDRSVVVERKVDVLV
jgi:hypothetical protein